MILIISMTLVMLYEVFLRYVVEAPTLWANELTLWIAGYVFLCSGLYAMQQRCHIRIFLLYDIVPRWLQRTFDVISVTLLALFAFFLVYGSFKQVFVVKFYKWEMFGTAFDPPIPATVQPMILIIVTLIALQALINLISDWNAEATIHTAANDIDKEELEAIKRSVGAS
jgi:TRAP-type C4-dicarboxylate transport system permease small subunit